MVLFTIRLKKRVILLVCIVFVIAIGFISISVYQWSKLANEEYFYNNPKILHKRLNELPSDFNIENIKRIEATVNPSQFKFAIMGDSHGNDKILKKIVNHAILHKPDFVIFLGDLTEQGKLRHYLKELNFVKRNIPIPFILVIGNHDYKNHGYLMYNHLFGPLDFYFNIGKYRFICIDNNFKEKVKRIVPLPNSDMEWDTKDGIEDGMRTLIEELLQEEVYINLIFMHQPPLLQRWNENAFGKGSDEFFSLVKKYNKRIPYVCAGHRHCYDRQEIYGVKFIISGGAGGPYRQHLDGPVPTKYHYVLFTVDNLGIKDKVYFID